MGSTLFLGNDGACDAICQPYPVDGSGAAGTAPSFTTNGATVQAGSSATYTVTLPSSVTSVEVNCLNLPSGAARSYSASAHTRMIAASTSTLAGTYQVTAVFTETLPGAAAAIALTFLLPALFAFKAVRRKRALAVAVFATVGIAMVTLSGRGGGELDDPTSSNR